MPPGLDIEDRLIGAVPVRLYRPTAGPARGVVVNVHGGGWVAGSIDGDDARCRIIAERARCVVASVGYRLAPEHPFPLGVEDCTVAIAWACRDGTALTAPAGKVAVLGASAGANMAAAAMLRLAMTDRDCRPVFQILFYPICDASMDWPSYAENGTGYFLTRRDMVWYWDRYMGGEDPTTPLASILRSDDLAALPPGLVVTAQYDPLRDEGEAFAEKLNAAGVPTECVRYPGAIHGFVSLAPESALTAMALDKVVALLGEAVGGS